MYKYVNMYKKKIHIYKYVVLHILKKKKKVYTCIHRESCMQAAVQIVSFYLTTIQDYKTLTGTIYACIQQYINKTYHCHTTQIKNYTTLSSFKSISIHFHFTISFIFLAALCPFIFLFLFYQSPSPPVENVTMLYIVNHIASLIRVQFDSWIGFQLKLIDTAPKIILITLLSVNFQCILAQYENYLIFI